MISVVIPLYNKEMSIGRTIQSVLNQSYRDFELIIVNDGSTDDSGRIAEKQAKNDARIKVIHQSNQGVSVARNTGFTHAIGEFITFIDSDDWIEKDYLTALTEHIVQNSSDLYVSGIIQDFKD